MSLNLFADRKLRRMRALYDYDPGVVVRAYWLPPWRDHHYFSFGRDRWDLRRTKAPVGRPKPAETYWRYWSNDGSFIHELPTAGLRSFDTAPEPRAKSFNACEAG
jgi:hypothetical protein